MGGVCTKAPAVQDGPDSASIQPQPGGSRVQPLGPASNQPSVSSVGASGRGGTLIVVGPRKPDSPTPVLKPENPQLARAADVSTAGAGVGSPTVVTELSPGKEPLQMQQVVSAKAVARRRRRGTVESTEMLMSRDPEGRKKINQYTMFETLGKGSYGKVKRCINQDTGETFAAKVVQKSFLKRKRVGRFGNALQTVQREMAIWKKLDHDNVVHLIEIIDDPSKDKIYMISEFIEGGPVMPDTKEHPPMTSQLARHIFCQLINALGYLHFQKVIHRDIKPGNLLITRSGVLKVADFGVSHMYDGEDDKVTSTAGTAAFLAPELVSGSGGAGQMVDVWATGVTLYMMLVGRPPFMESTLPLIYEAIQTKPVECPPELDPLAIDLIQKLLIKDPEERITVAAVKDHPWLQGAGFMPFSPLPELRLVATPRELDSAITKVATLKDIVIARRMSLTMLNKTRKRLGSSSSIPTSSTPSADAVPRTYSSSNTPTHSPGSHVRRASRLRNTREPSKSLGGEDEDAIVAGGPPLRVAIATSSMSPEAQVEQLVSRAGGPSPPSPLPGQGGSLTAVSQAAGAGAGGRPFRPPVSPLPPLRPDAAGVKISETSPPAATKSPSSRSTPRSPLAP